MTHDATGASHGAHDQGRPVRAQAPGRLDLAARLTEDGPPEEGGEHEQGPQHLAARVRPKTLYLIHHDPDDTDEIIDGKLATARERLAARGVPTAVVAPAELTDVVL